MSDLIKKTAEEGIKKGLGAAAGATVATLLTGGAGLVPWILGAAGGMLAQDAVEKKLKGDR